MHVKTWISMCLIGQSALALAQVTTEQTPSSSKTLPPSPTASICEPHGDHWHCHASSTAAAEEEHHSVTGSCEPHGDHWHCPSGVPKPTAPPTQTSSGAASTATDHHDHDDDHDHDHGDGKECTPHKDHWHCPSGVSAPTYPPTAAVTGAPSSTSGTAAAATSTPVTAGAGGRPVALATVGSLVGAIFLGALML